MRSVVAKQNISWVASNVIIYCPLSTFNTNQLSRFNNFYMDTFRFASIKWTKTALAHHPPTIFTTGGRIKEKELATLPYLMLMIFKRAGKFQIIGFLRQGNS